MNNFTPSSLPTLCAPAHRTGCTFVGGVFLFHSAMKKTIGERFLEKVDRRGEDDCWLWLAGTSAGGYGLFFNKGRIMAHRFSYQLHRGTIPQGLRVCHSCDNPPCVNPKHLWLGTPKDNTQDMMNKGRFVCRKRVSKCKRGHDLSIYGMPRDDGQRYCRKCRQIVDKVRHARRKTQST